MLAGHYAAAFIGRAAQPKLSLGVLFVAAQLMDLVWGALILTGVERAALDYSLPSNPLVPEYMPYTHSLLGTAVAAALAGLAAWRWLGSRRAGTIVACVVLSHWFLDLLMHRRDLTLTGAAPKVGLQLWNHPLFAHCFELGLLLVSFLVLRAVTREARTAFILTTVLVARAVVFHLRAAAAQRDANGGVAAGLLVGDAGCRGVVGVARACSVRR